MRQMNADQLVERAHLQTGLDSFDSDSYREGLDLLVSEVNRVGRFTDAGVASFGDRLVHFLSNRLKIDDYIRRHPEVLDKPIVAPLVVLGLPRTGSTLLNNLLAVDPARRSPLLWEFEDPIPPTTTELLTSDPRALARVANEEADRVRNPNTTRFRPTSAIFPVECTHIHALDFKSAMLEAFGPFEAYSDRLLDWDMTSAYDYERRFLQVLQHKAPGVWNLKMPSHALHVEWLLKAFPDARIVWTHRDPYTAMGSLCSLIANTHKRCMAEPDRGFIARRYSTQMAEHVNRMMAIRERLPPGQIFDHYYADIVRDPIAAVRRLYDWLGDEFSPSVEARINRWLAENPQGKWVSHAYKLDEFGLSVDSLRPFFAPYLAAYDVEFEGRG